MPESLDRGPTVASSKLKVVQNGLKLPDGGALVI